MTETLIWIGDDVVQKNKLIIQQNVTVLPTTFESIDNITLDPNKEYNLGLVYHNGFGATISFRANQQIIEDSSENPVEDSSGNPVEDSSGNPVDPYSELTDDDYAKYPYFTPDLILLVKKYNITTIDLITCDMPTLPEIEGITVRYSLDKTGNEDGESTNWILESHSLNIKELYFSSTEGFTEVLINEHLSKFEYIYDIYIAKYIYTLKEDWLINAVSSPSSQIIRLGENIIIDGDGKSIIIKNTRFGGIFDAINAGSSSNIIIKNLKIKCSNSDLTIPSSNKTNAILVHCSHSYNRSVTVDNCYVEFLDKILENGGGLVSNGHSGTIVKNCFVDLHSLYHRSSDTNSYAYLDAYAISAYESNCTINNCFVRIRNGNPGHVRNQKILGQYTASNTSTNFIRIPSVTHLSSTKFSYNTNPIHYHMDNDSSVTPLYSSAGLSFSNGPEPIDISPSIQYFSQRSYISRITTSHMSLYKADGSIYATTINEHTANYYYLWHYNSNYTDLNLPLFLQWLAEWSGIPGAGIKYSHDFKLGNVSHQTIYLDGIGTYANDKNVYHMGVAPSNINSLYSKMQSESSSTQSSLSSSTNTSSILSIISTKHALVTDTIVSNYKDDGDGVQGVKSKFIAWCQDNNKTWGDVTWTSTSFSGDPPTATDSVLLTDSTNIDVSKVTYAQYVEILCDLSYQSELQKQGALDESSYKSTRRANLLDNYNTAYDDPETVRVTELQDLKETVIIFFLIIKFDYQTQNVLNLNL